MKKLVLLFSAAMVVALAAQASPAAAAVGLFRTGAFAERGATPPYPTHTQGRIAVNFATGDVYVTDQVTDQVSVYRQNGGGADLLTSFGSGDFDDPLGVAIDQDDGSVYVSDADGITKFDSDNATTPTFTVDGAFAAVSATGPLAFDQSANQLVLADTSANIIRRYSTGGSASATFDGAGSPDTFGTGSTFTLLQDLAVDTTGDVIVIDAASDPGTGGTSRIERFTAAGAWEATIGPVDQAATVGIVPATNGVIVGGNQDGVNANEFPTVRLYAADGSDQGSVALHDSVIYGTTTGIAADDGPNGRVHIATDVSAGDWGGMYGVTSVQNYDLLQIPAAAILPATEIAPFRATLNGRINPEGAETTYHFEVSTDGGASWTLVDPDFDGDESAGAGSGDVEVSVTAPNLFENTSYQVRLVANRGFAHATSDTVTFTTTGTTDGITTSVASVTPTTATIGGVINPHGLPTTYQVEYRRKGLTAYERRPRTPASVGAGTTGEPYSVGLSGLRPNTAYEWRVVVTNPEFSATVDGPEFATGLSAPRADTTAATDTTPSSARLNGVLDPYGQRTTYHFEYGATSAYGTDTPSQTTLGARALRVLVDLTGLTPGQTIHYRVVATNATGTTRGADRTLEVPRSVRARVYERVTPAEKGGSDPLGTTSAKAAATGGQLAYLASTTHGTQPPSVTGMNLYLSRRGHAAWNTVGLNLPISNLRASLVGPFRDVSEDMTHGFGMSNEALAPGAVEGETNYYVTDTRTGQARAVAHSGDAAAFSDFQTDYSPVVTGTASFEHILFMSAAHLVPGLDSGGYATRHAYEVTPNGIRLASVDSDGNPLTSVEVTGDPESQIQQARHVMSSDGRRIFFSGVSSNGQAGTWMREDGERSVLMSASRRSGEPDPMGGVRVLDASADGGVAYFTTRAPLLPDSEDPARAEALRVYRYQADSDQLTEIYVAPAGSRQEGPIVEIGVSDDGERLAFVRQTSNGNDIYVWQDGKGLTRVAEGAITKPGLNPEVAVNPDLTTLAIQTMSSLEPADECAFGAGDDRCYDVYYYDVDSADLACVTCDPTSQVGPTRTLIGGAGSAFLAVGRGTPGFPIGSHLPRAVDARGGVYVDTQEQLTSEDNDSKFDVYYIRGGSTGPLRRGRRPTASSPMSAPTLRTCTSPRETVSWARTWTRTATSTRLGSGADSRLRRPTRILRRALRTPVRVPRLRRRRLHPQRPSSSRVRGTTP